MLKCFHGLSILLLFFLILGGCTPEVEIAPPEEPITINLNVHIKHEIQVKVEQDLEKVLSEENGLF
ncbi:MAG: YnbE family lipoprotein [Desulfobulbus propionicus]|nr:MAG: YnbE family lipoprotein [Desulfobulbus propionicus]